MGTSDYKRTLEIEHPRAECGHCRFTAALSGKFTVEDGRLVWRGDPDVQPGRGPDLVSCCESDPVAEFEFIVAGGERLPAEDVEALRATARAAVEAEMRAWHSEAPPDHER